MDSRVTLKKNYEFRRLYNKGKTAVTPYLVVYSIKTGRDHKRVGYTVSTKIGKAVTRNRIRRRLREIYRLNADRLIDNADIVIVARARCVDAEYAKLDKAFLHACSELHLIKEEQ